MKLSLPDITQAQIVAAVTWVISQIVSWGWIDNDQGQVALSASASFVAFAWIIADAFLRGKRNEVRSASIAAGKGDPAAKSSG